MHPLTAIRKPIVFALVYSAASVLWTIVIEIWFHRISMSEEMLTAVDTLKDVTYVLVSGVLIYVLLRRLDEANRSLNQQVSLQSSALIKSEDDLRVSEERLRRLLGNIPDVTWTSTADGRTTFVSSNIESVYGFTAQEVCERGAELWFDRIHSEHRERVIAGLSALFATGSPFDVEYQIQCKDGRWIWVHDRATNVYEESGTWYADGVFTDITERKVAELARDESERKYKALFERNLAGVFRSTAEGIILDYNPSLLRMLGYASMEELRGLPATTVFYDLAEAENAFKLLFKDGYLNDFEVRLRKKDGTLLWGLENVCLVPDEHGRTYIIEGTIIDITSRKKMEEELRQHQERLSIIVDSADLGVWDVDLTKDISYWSASCLAMYGLPPGMEMNRQSFLEAVHPDDRARVRQNIDETLATGREHRVEMRTMWPDGSVHWLASRGQVHRNEAGVPVRLSGVTHNIDTRKTAELALRQSEEGERKNLAQLHIALEAARSGAFDLDLVANRLEWSSELVSIYGLKPGEFHGTVEDWQSHVLPEDLEATLGAYRRRIERGSGVIQYRIRRSDNHEIRWVESRGQVFYKEGKPIRMMGVQSDISDLKRAELEVKALEEQFLQAQKMEAIGRLAGGVAHDFNNLLMVIRGYSEMIYDQSGDNPSIHAKSGEVLKAADRAASLSGQLLAFSRKQVLSPVVFDLSTLLNDTTKMLRRLIGEDVDLQVHTRGPLWAVRADRDQIVQVLMNLSVNARDAMPTGGMLEIETSNVTLDEAERKMRPYVVPGDYVCLTVTDNGTGISPEIQAHIFEPFFTTKEKGKGTGLGLSTVYGIVKQSGGYVFVESAANRGAKFTIYLPKVSSGLTATPKQEAPTREGGTETILVAEDEVSLRSAICEYLQGLGYNLISAESGQAAIEAASREHVGINLLITDVVMPNMSGRELSQILTGLRPGMKTLFMSGYIDDSVLRNGVAQGLAFLQKPFSFADLAKKVRALVKETVTEPA